MKLLRRSAAALAALAALILTSSLTSAPAQAAPAIYHAGMTWTVLEKGPYEDGTVRVGADSQTNAYTGDTSADTALPLLCLRDWGTGVPTRITPTYYAGWARGTVAATGPIPGLALTSREVADRLCSLWFGSDWRAAEFHDGRYGTDLELSGGWSFWAYGYVPDNQRFWVAINDQPANPWT
ncbi:hypothetical protein GCM10018793_47230 [Streptomyces sulfonofaciens]|uniref:Flagellar hook-length control protein n=1 Tax=Streptomyces sulfonofaciens TaxID=68272 RepID=A0A919L4Y4_9ACTN|nr:flagellar hook-length control protein [Streptomyces sulfonofaciens]GHH83997.1 hypothetical protein GCM10018793_47230 [Streptomyces sulfonofaciens]